MWVTPCVGVWIEIKKIGGKERFVRVTPCVGVWIEIVDLALRKINSVVTPCVGVWIEMFSVRSEVRPCRRHSLRGGVD